MFEDFYLVPPGDYVVVRDGPDDTGVSIGRFTGKPSTPSPNWSSTGRHLLVEFRSDHQYTAKGFKMNITFQENHPSE